MTSVITTHPRRRFQFEEMLARVRTHVALRQAREALRQEHERLRALERLRDDLVHMVVHDMRSPITALFGRLDFLKTTMCRGLMAVLAVTMVPVCATAGVQLGGRVAGTILDTTGAPLPAVTVTLLGGVTNVTTYTDPDGRFLLGGIPDGEYELTAALDGFAPQTRPIRIVSPAPVVLSLTLQLLFSDVTLVTADRMGERDVQSIPLTTSVLSADELGRVHAESIEDIAGRVPAVTFSQNTGFAQLTIRGIGTNAVFAGSDPSAAVYVDGVYLARPAMVLADFVGLERIEVLRGPQGTLYGRNAVGGAMNVITKIPTQDVETVVKTTVGNYGARRVEVLASGPITDRVMTSGALLRGAERGFVRDLLHPDHPLGGKDVTAAVGKLRVLLSGRSELVLSADVTHQDAAPLIYAKVLAIKPGFQIDNPAGFHDVRASTEAEGRNLQYGAAGRVTFQLSPGTSLTSLTAFRKLDYDVLTDSDITELDLASTNVHEIHHQVTEEVTVTGRQRALTWIGGVFLFDEVDRQPTVVGLGPDVQNRVSPRVSARSQAAFGQASFPLMPRLSGTAGLRYSRDTKHIVNEGGQYVVGPSATVARATFAYADAIAYTAWTPKLGIDARVHRRALVYASATRGFKAGGFNASSPEAGRGYAPEWAWSYEGGLKTTVAGHATLNASVFETRYTDLQVQTIIRPGVLDISNAASATIRGAELEGASGRTRPVRIGGHAAWLDARYRSYIAVGTGGVTGDVAGHRLNNAPPLSAGLWIEWEPNLGRGRVLSLRADARTQSTVFYTPFNDAIQQQPSYGLLDLGARLSGLHPCCTIGVYARNVTNQRYITGTFNSPPPAIGGRPGEPRQVMVQFTARP